MSQSETGHSDASTKPPSRRLSVYRPEYQILVELLRDVRNESGLSQQELARRLKVQQTFISKSEIKDRRIDLVEVMDICKACEFPLEEFIQRFIQRVQASEGLAHSDH